MAEQKNTKEASVKITGVAATIIDQYLIELGKNKDYVEVARRLKDALHKKGPANESAIRAALFGEETP